MHLALSMGANQDLYATMRTSTIPASLAHGSLHFQRVNFCSWTKIILRLIMLRYQNTASKFSTARYTYIHFVIRIRTNIQKSHILLIAIWSNHRETDGPNSGNRSLVFIKDIWYHKNGYANIFDTMDLIFFPFFPLLNLKWEHFRWLPHSFEGNSSFGVLKMLLVDKFSILRNSWNCIADVSLIRFYRFIDRESQGGRQQSCDTFPRLPHQAKNWHSSSKRNHCHQI